MMDEIARRENAGHVLTISQIHKQFVNWMTHFISHQVFLMPAKP